jgi:RNA recognition motif-containing protein
MIVFFDLRHARAMRMCDIRYGGYPLDVSFGCSEPVIDPRKPPNNGTVVIFHLKPNVSDKEIAREFGRYGKIRQVRQSRQRAGQRFVEFWDTRDAEAAVGRGNGGYLLGSRIAVEFSLPAKCCREPEPPVVIVSAPTVERRKGRPHVTFDVGRTP